MTTQKAERAGAVCDGCGAIEIPDMRHVEVVKVIGGVPAHIWYCPRCLPERPGEQAEVDGGSEQDGYSVDVQP